MQKQVKVKAYLGGKPGPYSEATEVGKLGGKTIVPLLYVGGPSQMQGWVEEKNLSRETLVVEQGAGCV